MHRQLLIIALVISMITGVLSDIYCHAPRCSNNRLNEQSANRNNANRCFDSQNNNRGGYNVGVRNANSNGAQAPDNTAARIDPNNKNTAAQYPMQYFSESVMTIEWTNQHGCGGNEKGDPNKPNCNLVLQYMCNTPADSTLPAALKVNLVDGTNTGTPTEPNAITDTTSDNNCRQESPAWYYECKKRARNQGLFTADQNLQGNTAKYTRQNPNGGRSGLECPEERDYYPYWAPSAWRDIAILTDRPDLCPMYLKGSQNNNPIFRCSGLGEQGKNIPITEAACTAAGGTWQSITHGITAPYCGDLGGKLWSRDNHLGNGRDGQPLTFNWTLPKFDDSPAGLPGVDKTNGFARCLFRIRYNISTDDYDPWTTNSTSNAKTGSPSPVTNNPTINVQMEGGLQGLRLAVNTAQFGRTFQDRSHVFDIVDRSKLPAQVQSCQIWNLNVRGKRGNIVQTYPSVEYDFVPNYVAVKPSSCLHVQWTGSNTHNNGNPAGDGQAGDAGEGTGGTDRHNFVIMGEDKGANFPLPLDKATSDPFNIIKSSTCVRGGATAYETVTNWQDCAVQLATSGHFLSTATVDGTLSVTLDNAPPSLIGGVVLKLSPENNKKYNYMCTRNNNFSNRGQKGTIVVNSNAPDTITPPRSVFV